MIRQVLILLLAACGTDVAPAGGDPDLGYAIGFQVGRDFEAMGEPIDREALLDGIRDALAERRPRLTVEEQKAALRALRKRSE